MCSDWGKGRSDYKLQAIMAAKDFGYGQEVINQIEQETDDDKIANIMSRARRKKFG